MKEEKQSGIYQIRNIKNNKVYIGSSARLYYRKIEHFSRLRNNSHDNSYLQKSWNKYGEENFVFEILEYCEENSLLEREQHYFDTLKCYDSSVGYNINPLAGKHFNIPVPVIQLSLSGEYIDTYPSIKEANIAIGVNCYNYGIGACINGVQQTAFGFRWVHYNPETFKNDIENYVDTKIVKPKLVQQIDLTTGEVLNTFNNISEAEKFLNKNKGNSTIRQCIDGHYSHSHGFKWRWFEVTKQRKPLYYLSIDPGKKGSIVIIKDDSSEIYKFIIPLIKDTIDTLRLIKYIKSWAGYIKHCTIEDVHSVFGASAKANFSFGYICGLLEGIIIANQIPLTKITPKVWQREMWVGIKVIEINTGKKTKEGNIKYKTDTKATSLIAAQKIFP